MNRKKNKINVLQTAVSVILLVSAFMFVTGCEDTVTEAIKDEVKLAELPEYSLTILDPDFGSVTPSGEIKVKDGIEYSITVSVPSGGTFINWEIIAGDQYAVIADTEAVTTTVKLSGGDATIKPIIAETVYTLTVNNDGHGTTDPSGSVVVGEGIERSVIAYPSAGYDFTQWNVTSGTVVIGNENSASTKVTLNEGDATIEAAFTIIEHTLTLESDTQGGIIYPSSPATVNEISSTSIAASNPTERGYYFSGWSQSGGTGTAVFADSSSRYTSVTVKDGDVTIKANYDEITATLTYKGNLDLGSTAYKLTHVNDIVYDNGYIYAVGDYQYDSDSNKYARIIKIDVSSPSNPSYSSYRNITTSTDSEATEIIKEDSYLYVGVTGAGGDEYYSTIDSGSGLNSFTSLGFSENADHITGDNWISDGSNLYKYYIRDPYDVGTDDPLADILRIDDYLYVTLEAGLSDYGHLQVYDINSSDEITQLTSNDLDNEDVSPGNMVYDGDNYVYIVATPSSVGGGDSGILTAFAEENTFSTQDNFFGTTNTGDIEYVAVGDNSNYLFTLGEGSGYDRIAVFDIHGNNGSYKAPYYIYSRNTYSSGLDVRAIEVSGDYLYTIEGTNLVIYQISTNAE